MKLFPILCTLAAASAIPAQGTVLVDLFGGTAGAEAFSGDVANNTGTNGTVSYLHATAITDAAGAVTGAQTFVTLGTGAGLDTDNPVIGNGLDQGALSLFSTNASGTSTLRFNTNNPDGMGGTSNNSQFQPGPFAFINLANTGAVHPGTGNTGPIIQYTLDASDIALGASAFQVSYSLNNISVNGDGVNFVTFADDVAVNVGAIADGSTVSDTFNIDASGLAAGDTISLFLSSTGNAGVDGSTINSLTISAIPEPSSALLLGFAGMAFAIRRRR